MVKTSFFLGFVVLTFICIEILILPYDYVKPDNKHGERKRRFILPQRDAMLLAEFRSNATSFIMSIVGDYNSTERDNSTQYFNNSLAILLPNHIMLRVYTAFLDHNRIIRASFPENITPFRNLSYLFDVDIFTATSPNSTAPIIKLNKIDYVIVAHGLFNETNILIAMQRPDHPPIKYDGKHFNFWNQNPTHQNNKPRNPPSQQNLDGVITFPIKRYIYNSVDKPNHVLQTQKNHVVQYPSTYGVGYNDNWNTFSGYKHLPKPVTVVTHRPDPNRFFYHPGNLRSSSTSQTIRVNSRSSSSHASSAASRSRSGGSRGRG